MSLLVPIHARRKRPTGTTETRRETGSRAPQFPTPNPQPPFVVYPNQMTDSPISRRSVLAGAAALLARPGAAKARLKVAIFSKHLQFVQGDEMARAATDLGFDAVDITVRKGGHVEPARVAADLPPLVAAIRRRGLEVPMVTTDIVDAETPFAEDVLRTASGLGIRHYRFGGFRYAADQPYPAQLEAFRSRLAKLALLNGKYQTCAMYHTHSGAGLVGASIWDLYLIMRDLDPARMGVNFDVAHATVEGGLGGWINSFRITGPHVRGIAVKDFVWGKNSHGQWDALWTPLGEGMVRWPQFWEMVAQSGFDGPLQVHFEYELGPSREATYAAMKRDLATLRGQLAKAGL
jgi:sugar phosphate isomerase/epimerase